MRKRDTVQIECRFPKPVLEACNEVAKFAGLKVDQVIAVALAVQVIKWKERIPGPTVSSSGERND